MLWGLVTLILFSALLLALAAFGPLRGAPSARPIFALAGLQALVALALIAARLSGVA